MTWIGLAWTVALFGIAVLLIATGTVAGRPLTGSCGGACTCLDGEEACERDGQRVRQQHLDTTAWDGGP